VSRGEFMIERIKIREKFVLLIVYVDKKTIQMKSLLESQSFKRQIIGIMIDGSIKRKNQFNDIVVRKGKTP